MDLTDKQWARLELVIVERDAPGKDLPDRCPPHRTYRRPFQEWVKPGMLRRIAEELAAELQERCGIDLREAFIDGGFVPQPKRRRCGRPSCGAGG